MWYRVPSNSLSLMRTIASMTFGKWDPEKSNNTTLTSGTSCENIQINFHLKVRVFVTYNEVIKISALPSCVICTPWAYVITMRFWEMERGTKKATQFSTLYFLPWDLVSLRHGPGIFVLIHKIYIPLYTWKYTQKVYIKFYGKEKPLGTAGSQKIVRKAWKMKCDERIKGIKSVLKTAILKHFIFDEILLLISCCY